MTNRKIVALAGAEIVILIAVVYTIATLEILPGFEIPFLPPCGGR